jgi:hypothetical protein
LILYGDSYPTIKILKGVAGIAVTSGIAVKQCMYSSPQQLKAELAD